jgi:hypothetical protein
LSIIPLISVIFGVSFLWIIYKTFFKYMK